MSYFTEHKPTQVADEKAILDPIPFALEQSPNGVEDPADPDFLPFILKDQSGTVVGGHYVNDFCHTSLLVAMHDGIEDIESFLDICTIPVKIYNQLLAHPLTDKGQAKFLADFKSSMNA